MIKLSYEAKCDEKQLYDTNLTVIPVQDACLSDILDALGLVLKAATFSCISKKVLINCIKNNEFYYIEDDLDYTDEEN